MLAGLVFFIHYDAESVNTLVSQYLCVNILLYDIRIPEDRHRISLFDDVVLWLKVLSNDEK